MFRHHNRSYRVALSSLLVISTIFVLLFAVRFFAFAAPNPIQAAWQLARQSGAYQFKADVIQYTDPVPSIRNTGRTSEKEEMYMQGQTNLHTRIMDMKFWSQGGSLSTGQGQIEIQVRDGQAFARTMGGEWEEVNNFTGLFAPDSNFLVYLKGARHLKNLGNETRTLPSGETIAYTRYSFTINSLHLAQYMRDALQQHAVKYGELPPGVSLKMPKMYQDMQGTGEVWIGANGLPLRQILHVQFPEQNNEQLRAEITTDFSHFADPSQLAMWQWHLNSGAVGTAIQQWIAAYGKSIVMGIIALVLSISFLLLLIFRRRSRPIYATFALFFATILIVQPLMMNLKVANAAENRNVQATEQKQQREEVKEREAQQANALEPSIDPHTSPLIQAQDEKTVRSVQTYDENGEPRLATIDASEWDHVMDDDGDGDTTDDDDGTNSDSDSLTDAQEAVLGTDSTNEDTDSDGVDDDDEVEGFSYNGETWYTDPLNPDTNSDGVMDGQEWETDLDSDGIPDVYDRDNDGDGVPDFLDDSPNQSTSGSAVTTMNYQVTGLDDGNKPTTVEFQVRPEEASRIWYADNVLDWPSVDNEGNVQDADGATFADVDMLTDDSRADYGDMTLVPLLEVRIQSSDSEDNTSGSVTSQLPYDTQVTIELDPVSSDDDEHWVYLAQDDSNTLSMTTADTETMPDGWEFSLVRSDCDTYTDDDTDTSTIDVIGNGASGTTLSGNLQDLQEMDSDSDDVNDSYAIIATESDAVQACGDVPTLVFEGDTMIDYDQMREYNITVRKDTNGDILAYVPVTVVEDSYTGEKVAFSGTMYYQPDTSSTWGDNQVGLIWGVQVLTDICESTDDAGACESYSDYNESNLVHTYADDWYLTGFSVREDYGSDLAIILDDDLTSGEAPNNASLMSLAISLSRSFEYSADISVQDLYDQLDQNETPTLTDTDGSTYANPFQVEKSSYTTLDELTSSAATSSDLEESTTLEVLDQYFTSHASQYSGDTYYSLLFARSDIARTVTMEDIEDYMTIDTSSGDMDMVVDFSGAATSTDGNIAEVGEAETHTISMAHYEYLGEVADGASWAGVDIEDYLEWVENNNRLDELTSDAYDALDLDYSEENQQGLLDLLLMAYATLYTGSSIVVAVDGVEVYLDETIDSIDLTIDYVDVISSTAIFSVASAYNLYTDLAYYTELATTMYNTFKNLSTLAKGAVVGGVIVGIALLALAVAQVLGAFGDDDGWSIYAKVTIGIIGGAYVLVAQIIYPAYVALKIYSQMVVSGLFSSTTLTYTQAAQKLGYLKNINIAKVATVVVTVIIVIALISVFIATVISEGIQAGSIAFDSLLAYTIASIIVAVVLMVIAFIPVVGQIIVGILALIDLIVWLVTGNTASDHIAMYLAEAFYSVNVMVEFDDSVFGDIDTDLVTDDDGYIAGNQIKITQEIASTVRHVEPDVEYNFAYLLVPWGSWATVIADYYARLAAIESYYTKDNIRDVVMQYELSSSDTMDEVAEGAQSDAWDVTDNSYKYQATLSDEVENTFTLETGINFHPSLYLNYAYAVSTVACWSFGIECDYEWTKDTENAGDYGEGLSYDVFPATIDDFLTLSSRDGGYYLGWDESFDIIADADGDELLSSVLNGSDPDDTTWDLDNDGMSDLYELEQQEEGYYFDPSDSDSDDDMVPDADESWFGSNPANEDSDGDGLYDCEEIYHQLRSSDDRAACDSFVNSRTGGERTSGGWMVLIGGDGSLQYSAAWSDPTEPDTDGDGLNDLAEYELREKGYHPQVVNDNPLSINTTLLDSSGNEYDESYVSPGTRLTLENVVSTSQTGSDSNTSWDNSLQIEFDDELGGDTKTWSLDLANDEDATVTYDFTLPSNSSDGTHDILNTIVARSIPSASGDWVLSVADEETLTSSLGNETTRGIGIAPIAGDTESYLYTTFTSDSDDPGGHGDVYTVKSGGSPKSIESDSGDLTYLRSGNTGPGVVCNDSGTCFVTWADVDNCSTLTVDSITVNSTHNDPNGGIEPFLFYKDYDDSGYTGWWYTNWASSGSVTDLTGLYYSFWQWKPRQYTHGFPKSHEYCEQITLRVEEVDGDCTDLYSSCSETDDEYVGERTFDIFEDDYNETEVEYYNTSLDKETDNLTCFSERSDMDVCFETSLDTYERVRYNVAGALTNTSGSKSKSRFSVASSTSTGSNTHDYNPVVATDGEDFLVAWERMYYAGSSTYSKLFTRGFDDSGSAVANQKSFSAVITNNSWNSDQSIPPKSRMQPQRQGYDMAWTGDYYALVYHHVGTSSENIYLRFLDSSGSSQATITLESSSTTDDLSTPRIASSPNNNRIGVVYEDNALVYLLIGYVNGTSVTWDDEILVGIGSDPDIGYEAQSQSWVVSWSSETKVSSLLGNAGPVGRGQNSTTTGIGYANVHAGIGELPLSHNEQVLSMLLMLLVLLALPALALSRNVVVRRIGQSVLMLGASFFIMSCTTTTSVYYRNYQVYDLYGNSIGTASSADSVDSTDLALQCPDPDTAPLAQFSLEEPADSTAFASDYGEATGTCSGDSCPSTGVAGEREMGGSTVQETWVSFDGSNDYLEVDDIELDNRSFTVAFWARRNSSGNLDMIVTQGTNSTNNGLHIGFRGNDTFTCAFWGNDLNTSATYTDNDWHHWTCTYNESSGKRVIYLDGEQVTGNSSGVSAYTGSGTLNIGRRIQGTTGYFDGDIDDVRIYQTALDSDAVDKIYSNALQNVCVAASHTGDSIVYTDIKMSQTDAGESRIDLSNTIEVSVDATAPEVSFTSIEDGDIISIKEGYYKTISGSAYDQDSTSSSEEASGVASVEISTDGGTTWNAATGLNSWSYNISLDTGTYTIQVRATDEAGNTSTATSMTITIDNDGPSVTLDTPDTSTQALQAATETEALRLRHSHTIDLPGWRLPLAGTASDTASNVTDMTFTVDGDGQKVATMHQRAVFDEMSSTDWYLDYLLNDNIYQPNGEYVLEVETKDSLTNTYTETLATVFVDNTAPVADIVSTGFNTDFTDIMTPVTEISTFTGYVTDTGDVASGVRAMEWSLANPEEVYFLQDIAPDRELDLSFDAASPYEHIPWNTTSYCQSDDTCPSTTSDGKVGNGMLFDGSNDYLEMDMGEVYLENGFTMAAWIYPTGGNNSGYHGFFGYNNGAIGTQVRAPSMWVRNGNQIHAGFGDGSNWNSLNSTTNVLTLNEWNHVVSTFDGTTYRIYVNGEEVVISDSGTKGYDGLAGKTPFVVTKLRVGRVDNYFAGTIDDALFYNRALNADEVAILASDGGRITDKPLLDMSFDDEPVISPVVDMSAASYRNYCSGDKCPTQTLDGIKAEALAFDGNNDELTLLPIDLANKSFTVSFWARRSNTNGGDYVISQGAKAQHKGLHIGFRDNNTFTCAFWGNDLNMDFMPDTSWHHWSCTYDANTNMRTIYMDGDALVKSDKASADYQGSGNLTIGLRRVADRADDGFFGGLLDEFSIYNRPLSADEVLSLASREPPSDAPLISLGFNIEANHAICSDGSCPDIIADGVTGEAVHFDGTKILTIPDNDSLDLDHSFTIGMWVRPEKVSSAWQSLVAKPSGSFPSRNYSFFIKPDTMQPLFSASKASCDSGFGFSATKNLTEDAWNYLAATYDGNQFTLYVNGEEAGTRAHSGGICQNDYELMIGRNDRFYGDLDDIVIYERPLSANEITALMHGQEPSDIPVLDLSFNALEPYVLPAVDTSGNSNHAYCQGGKCPESVDYGLNDEAMLFDGVDDGLSISDGIDLANSSFSVSFWARRDSSGTSDYIVSQGYGATNQGLHMGFRSNDTFTCAFWNNGFTTSSTYTDNEWHHWTCTYDVDAKQRAIYRDGERIQSIQTNISAYEGSGTLFIGSLFGNSGTFFHGALDDVRIYNQALSQAEIGAIYRDADRTWYDAILGSKGATSSSWSLTIPEDIEAFYQLDTRGTDMLGNRNTNHGDWGTWRGEIDNKYPEVAINGTYNGTTIDYTCTTTDFSLDEDSLTCVDEAALSTTDTETYYTADWWEDLTADSGDERLIGLTRNVESDSVIGELEVCDYYGHCSTAETNVATDTLAAIASVASLSADPPPQDPQLLMDNKLPPSPHPFIEAYYMAPAFGSYYDTITPISVTVAVTTTKGTLETISLGANGKQFEFLDLPDIYGKPMTNTVHYTQWTPPEDGFYKLGMEVRTTAGDLYRSRPITLVVDTQSPQITIQTDKLTRLHQDHGTFPVLLQGDFKDQTRVRVLEVQVNDSEWARAHILPNGRWDFPITRLLNVQFAEDELTGRRRITYPDNETFTVNVRATDAVGNVGTATKQIVIDYVPPKSVNVALSYMDSDGTQVPIQAGDTVRIAPAALQMTWEASSDSSGIEAYLAGFTRQVTPTIQLLTEYTPEVRQHTQSLQELDVVYAHLGIRDTQGNGWLQTLGPIYIDTPQTPDLVDDSATTEAATELAQLQQLPPPPDDGTNPPTDEGTSLDAPPVPLQDYTGWRQSGCSFIGFSEERAERARSGHPYTQQQRFYTTWSEKGLRITWDGANWNSDGDMFLYLNTQDGGSDQVFNPYPGVEVPDVSYTPNAIAGVVIDSLETHRLYLPFVAQGGVGMQHSQASTPSLTQIVEDDTETDIISATTEMTSTRIMTPSIKLPFAADYMLWVTDTLRAEWITDTSHINLLVWDEQDGQWKPADGFTRDYVWYEILGRRTNVYLPFSVLGIPDPQNTPLDMIALASESDALHLWATMPDGNLLNSPNVTSDFVSPDLRYAEYTLDRAYHWDSLGSGICPSGEQYGGVDVSLEITSDPMMAFYNLMGDGLYGVQADLFAGAEADKTNMGFRGRKVDALPLGTEVNYTIAYRNDGTETMNGVALYINGYDWVSLPDGEQITDGDSAYDRQILPLGDLAPNQSGEVTFRILLDPNGAYEHARARLDVALHNAVSLERGDRPLDVYWTIITVDNTPPEGVRVTGPTPPYVAAGAVRVTGTMSDTSEIASITLEQKDSADQVVTHTCSGNNVGVGTWGCTIIIDGTDSETIQVRAKAEDEHGLVSEWSDWKTFTIDHAPPEVLLPQDAAQMLVTKDTPPLQVGIRDNLAAVGTEVCIQISDSEPTCSDVTSDKIAQSIQLSLPFAVTDGMDGIMQFWTITGFDHVGNRSTAPVTATYLFDNVAPQIEITSQQAQVALADYEGITNTTSLDVTPLLSGTATDGSQVTNVTARLIRPSGDRLDRPVFLDAETGEWRLVTPLTQTGTYRIRIRAMDVAGNLRETKLYEVVVQ